MGAVLKGSLSSTAKILVTVPWMRLLIELLLPFPLSRRLKPVQAQHEQADDEREAETQAWGRREPEKDVGSYATDCIASAPTPEGCFSAMPITRRPPPTFLTLPLEVRLEIYSHLLLLPPYGKHQDAPGNGPRVYPALLATCAQVYTEAAPMLYGANTWQAHTSLLTSLPRLRAFNHPVTQPGALAQIRRWRMSVRLDIACPFTAEAVTAAFTGADELALEVWQATFWGGAGVDVLERFEGVRGVRKVRIVGSTTGFEGYLRWLAASMTAPVGREVEKYVAADERERKRLRGWS
ncbi:hypothetical protein GQ53DRAFT_746916 [Thozetella sp. PMI_491]|nr:hypothetical protein GQ53DRAFT_746916 [Thozetella sp. PMI_491]